MQKLLVGDVLWCWWADWHRSHFQLSDRIHRCLKKISAWYLSMRGDWTRFCFYCVVISVFVLCSYFCTVHYWFMPVDHREWLTVWSTCTCMSSVHCRRGVSDLCLHVGVCSWRWIWLAVGWTLERRGSELALYNCRCVSSDKWVIDMAMFAGYHVRSLSDWAYSEAWLFLTDRLGRTYDNDWQKLSRKKKNSAVRWPDWQRDLWGNTEVDGGHTEMARIHQTCLIAVYTELNGIVGERLITVIYVGTVKSTGLFNIVECVWFAGEVLSRCWTRWTDSTPSQVQPGTAAAEWNVLSAVRCCSGTSKDGMLLDVIQYSVWQSLSDFWHRADTGLTYCDI